MKRLIFKDGWMEYSGDVHRIVDICEKQGFYISYNDAFRAWEMYSESMAAGWMGLNQEDEYVFNNIRPYLLEVN